MPGRTANKIRLRKENVVADTPPAKVRKPRRIFFWLAVIFLVSVIGFLGYFVSTCSRDSLCELPNESIVAIVIFAVLLSTLLIWYVPKFIIQSLPSEAGTNFDHTSAKLSLENSTRGTIAQIVGGMVLLGGVVFTFNSFRLQQEGQFTDRFTTAITQIGNDKLEIRLGGLYALERISKDSPTDYPTVMEVLSAYIREKGKIKDAVKPAEANSNKAAKKQNSGETTEPEIATDVQAALTIIGRRKTGQGRHTQQIDLTGSDLSRASLSFADLSGAELSRIVLSRALIFRSDFRRANFFAGDLRGAFLQGSNFKRASFSGTNSSETDFSGSELSLTDLSGADLRDAKFKSAELRGADFTDAKNLTFEQLAEAHIDENTRLPDYLEDRKAELLEISRKNPLEEDPWWKSRKDPLDDFE